MKTSQEKNKEVRLSRTFFLLSFIVSLIVMVFISATAGFGYFWIGMLNGYGVFPSILLGLGFSSIVGIFLFYLFLGIIKGRDKK